MELVSTKIIKIFKERVNEFEVCIEQLPPDSFLREINGWSPRDIIAHFIGWNRATILVCQQILQGEFPDDFSDPGEDFCKVNARFIKENGSQDRDKLIADLMDTQKKLTEYLKTIPEEQWIMDFGIVFDGEPLTVQGVIDDLSQDYVDHRKLIEEWQRSAR